MNYTPILETDRLIIRPMTLDDVEGHFSMDSQPEVHTYLKAEPLQKIEESEKMIESIQIQYKNFGVGRVAVIEKESGEFIGWTGFKFIEEKEAINNQFGFLDFVYRYKKEAWGKGYATEAAKACMDYYLKEMTHFKLNALTHIENKASRNVLEKIGFEVTETFIFDLWEIDCFWYELKSGIKF
ncbi:GNAT family N-acetyltransferase [Chishuiella changwenlii]|uniref:GNAT family N-acetyltransferase n=1 Tax=Chishuiella changwenlii TaxID=1434701 RepID=UPI002FD9BBEA